MRGLRGMSCVVFWMASLAGCSRPAEQAPSPAADSSTPAAPATAAAPAQPPPADIPTDSSLSLKRGIVMLAQDRMTFLPCGETGELWLVDQTDGVLEQAFASDAPRSPTKLYIEAYGERAAVADDIPAARAYAGTFLLEEVLYAGLQADVKGCDAPAPKYIVAARGNEPFWAVEVGETQIVWRQPDDPKEISLGPPQMQDAEGAVHYHASANGHQVELLIDAQQCRDSMSGEFFAYAAKALLDGKEFTGCARVGE